MPGSRTIRGSVADRIRILLDTDGREYGGGKTAAELREAYSARFGQAPRVFTPVISNMVRRGVLIRLGGRAGHIRYGLPGIHRQAAQLDPDADSVLVALRYVLRTTGAPAPTRAVHRAIRELGLPLSSEHPNLVRKRLETLSRARQRGPEQTRDPRVERVTPPTQHHSTPAAYWVISGWRPPTSIRPVRSAAQAFRDAVAAVTDALGRPATRSEVRLWLRTPHAPESLRRVLPANRLGTIARDTIRADSASLEPGRIVEIGSRWACHGGPEGHLGVRGGSGPATVHLRHAVQALRLPEELRSLQALEHLVERSDSSAGVALLEARGAAIHQALDGAESRAHAETLSAALGQVEVWLRKSGASANVSAGWHRTIALERAGLDALARIPDHTTAAHAPFTLFGSAGTTNTSELGPIVRSFAQILRLEGRAMTRQIERARRTPDRPSPVLGDSGHETRFDRADALFDLYENLPNPVIRSALWTARAVLGEVLRDAGLLRRVLVSAEAESTTWLVEGALLALGLLGEAADSQFSGLDARILSRWLADPDCVAGWLETVSVPDGTGHRVIQMAQASVGAGFGAALVG